MKHSYACLMTLMLTGLVSTAAHAEVYKLNCHAPGLSFTADAQVIPNMTGRIDDLTGSGHLIATMQSGNRITTDVTVTGNRIRNGSGDLQIVGQALGGRENVAIETSLTVTSPASELNARYQGAAKIRQGDIVLGRISDQLSVGQMLCTSVYSYP